MSETGIDLEKDLINALAGRLSYATWMERPPRINSQASLIGVQLTDAAATREVLERLRTRFPDRLAEEAFGGVTYYRLPTRGNREADEQTVRQPTPSVAILGDYLLVTDSAKFLQQAIITKQDPTESLANELEFKLIAGKIGRQLNGAKPGMTSFNRPEEGLRNFYEMANSPTMRSQLASRAANNRFFKALNDALVANPLPPFSVLAQYLAPGGAMLTNDDTGLHYTAFTLRRE